MPAARLNANRSSFRTVTSFAAKQKVAAGDSGAWVVGTNQGHPFATPVCGKG